MPLAEVARMRRKYSDLVLLVDKARREGRGRTALTIFLRYLEGEISEREAEKKLRALAEAG